MLTSMVVRMLLLLNFELNFHKNLIIKYEPVGSLSFILTLASPMVLAILPSYMVYI